MYPVKLNFKKKYNGEFQCEFCVVGDSSQQHQLECAVLTKFVPEIADSNIEYNDIFGSVDDQLAAVKLFTKITKQRNLLLEALQSG